MRKGLSLLTLTQRECSVYYRRTYGHMEEIIIRIIKISLPLSVIANMFGLGLKVHWSEVAAFRDRRLLILRSIATVVLLVPLAALGIILLLKPVPGVAVGLAIILASPAAPLQLVRVAAREEVSHTWSPFICASRCSHC